jgi:hypothetical protein
MPHSADELRSWRERRAARLNSLPWLRVLRSAGRPEIWYADRDLLVPADQEEAALALLRDRYGVDPAEVSSVDIQAAGFRRLRHPAIDPVEVSRRLRDSQGEDAHGRLASPNHVYTSTSPIEQGGPFGPPVAVARPQERLTGPRDGALAVAVVDTGVWTSTPLPSRCYEALPQDLERDPDADDDGVIDGEVGHANFIAGIIHRHTGTAHVRVLRVLDSFGVCTEEQLLAGLARIRSEQLINLSLGGYTLDDQPPLPVRDALAGLLTGPVDRLVVAAAGNDGNRDRPFWPAAFTTSAEPWRDRVLAVAAHDGRDLCDWSNAGPWVTLTALGADLVSTYVRHREFPTGWARWSGTSFAAPRVVAELAERLAAGDTAESARKNLVEGLARGADGYPRLA